MYPFHAEWFVKSGWPPLPLYLFFKKSKCSTWLEKHANVRKFSLLPILCSVSLQNFDLMSQSASLMMRRFSCSLYVCRCKHLCPIFWIVINGKCRCLWACSLCKRASVGCTWTCVWCAARHPWMFLDILATCHTEHFHTSPTSQWSCSSELSLHTLTKIYTEYISWVSTQQTTICLPPSVELLPWLLHTVIHKNDAYVNHC